MRSSYEPCGQAASQKRFSLFRTKPLFFLLSVADPGSGAFLITKSGIRNRFFPDLGSRIPGSYILEPNDNFLGTKFVQFFVN